MEILELRLWLGQMPVPFSDPENTDSLLSPETSLGEAWGTQGNYACPRGCHAGGLCISAMVTSTSSCRKVCFKKFFSCFCKRFALPALPGLQSPWKAGLLCRLKAIGSFSPIYLCPRPEFLLIVWSREKLHLILRMDCFFSSHLLFGIWGIQPTLYFVPVNTIKAAVSCSIAKASCLDTCGYSSQLLRASSSSWAELGDASLSGAIIVWS